MEPEQDRSPRLLCFGAHPDDCEIKSGGLAALWTRAGGQARFVALTDGSAGHHELAGSRWSGGAAPKPRPARGRPAPTR